MYVNRFFFYGKCILIDCVDILVFYDLFLVKLIVFNVVAYVYGGVLSNFFYI